jgi:hypothetical protein
MYRYDSERNPIDLKLVDYQLCFWGTPALDIWYIMISSWHEDFKIAKFDYLIKYYHDKFVESLKILKYEGKVPTLEELHAELNRKSFVGAAFSIEGLPFKVPPPEVVAGDEYHTIFLRNPKYLDALALILPFLDERGGLDVVEETFES